MGRKSKKSVDPNTRVMIDKAMEEFLKRGGKIRKLPDQDYNPSQTIGADKWGAYESIHQVDHMY